MTLQAIAKADGTVSKQTVMRALDDPVIPNGKTPSHDHRQGRQSMTLQAIAEADGTVSKDTVQRRLDSTFANEKVPAKTIGKDKKKRPPKYKPRKKKSTSLI